MVILGIDPGLAIVGWGLIESHRGQLRPLAYGAITTPAHTPIESRLSIIREDLSALIEKYKPDEIASIFSCGSRPVPALSIFRIALLRSSDKDSFDDSFVPPAAPRIAAAPNDK